MKAKSFIAFVLTPLAVTLILLFVKLDPANPKVSATFAVALLMASWWITEAVPLAVTSLLPVALFPLLGIMDGGKISAAYFNDVIFLFMGGFLVALAMERWNLHKRIALKILSFIGVSPARILLGFMAASFFLSMWISNTATAMMMLPIAVSIISELDACMEKRTALKFSVGLLLGIAYSASAGGMATLVGTPPNLSFVRIFQIYFPKGPEIAFSKWLLFALPVSLLIFATAWWLLYLLFRPRRSQWTQVPRNIFRDKLRSLGAMVREEKVVLAVFALLALLWITRVDLDFGAFTIPGWSGLFTFSAYISDGTVAILMAVILFLIPSRQKPETRILDWPTASRLPWEILLLFGGGFALATGFKESGLSLWFGGQLRGLVGFHPILTIFLISLIMTFLTELTSNTAITEMALPILAGIAISSSVNPLLLMVPATLSASMAFMLPVATPPNAIIFGTGRVKISEMARVGLILNLVGAAIIALLMYFWGSAVFGIAGGIVPEWILLK